MTTMIVNTEGFRDRPAAPAHFDGLRAGLRALLRRREDRRALERLWRLGPRLVRDAGLDPDQVRAAVGGGWDDLLPAGRLLASRRPRV